LLATFGAVAEPLWSPGPERVRTARLTEFRTRYRPDAPDFAALHRWSVEHREEFWAAVWEYTGLIGERGRRPSFDRDAMPGARFFPDATLNFARNLLRGGGDAVALVAIDEDRPARTVSWSELRAQVGAASAALRADDVGAGDRVVAWLPNGVEAVVTMLAAASIGATFSSCSPDFGVAGVLDRFRQIEPAVLVAADGYRYGGARFDCLGRLEEIRAGLPTLRRTVLAGHLDEAATAPGTTAWADWLATGRGAAADHVELPFDHPLYVLYSSGTTGPPKCIVHRAGGILLKHAAEQQLQCDVRAGDRVLYFTTTGWMMWNWLVSALGAGAAIVLVDGSPSHPSPDRLFQIVDDHGVTLLGVGAKFLDALRKAGERPADHHDLGHLRTICSTGSPLVGEGFEYVYGAIKHDVHLASISGGTDLCGCIVMGDPTRPVHAGELQGPALGVAADVYRADATPAATGETGELVVTAPFPSMPLRFGADPDGTRYRAAYFERFIAPGGGAVWAHGDFAYRTEHGGFVITGRSDATLNPGGVRLGTAELYRAVEALPEVAEALAVGQPWDGDVRVVLFVRLSPGAALDGALTGRIRHEVRTRCSPRHVPARVVAVADLPRTRSGKLAELAVADVVAGREVRNTEALANADVLESFRDLPELAR
jgi:acetoacetyl-CoA synthetase